MIKYNRFTLSNGLRVIHSYDSATAMVALNLLYDVGARDEEPHLTGMAHLFEHLMFGGSEHILHFDKELERAGGTNNAWTNPDYTNFYDILPAHNAETAFWLESDRMNGLAFSDKSLEVQRSVVSEEFKQVCLNQPYGDLMHHLLALAYERHPYRIPVIGKELEHIQRVTQDDVRRFFYAHYAPNNAVLAVTGHIELEKVRELAEKWFGPIPRRDIAPRRHAQEPRQTAPRRLVVTGQVPQTVITKAWHKPGIDSPLYEVADTMTDLLASGYSSRFYRRLMLGTELFTRCDASITGSVEPGLILANGYLRDGVDEEEAEEALEATVGSLATDPPSAHELERVLNNFESTRTFADMNYVNLAFTLAQCEMQARDINDIVARRRAVTVDDIVEATRTLIVPDNCSTLIYRPE